MNTSVEDAYNSLQAQKTYLSKRGLTQAEEEIMNTFSDKKIRILDIGCGGGRTTHALYEKGFKNIIGIDIAEKLIDGAKKNFPEIADKFGVGNASKLDFSNESFDVVLFSFNGIDYIPSKIERLQVYKEIHRVLTLGGKFIFSSHNRFCFPTNRNLLKTIIENIPRLLCEYWITQQSFGKLFTYYSSPWVLKRDLEKYNFRRIRIYPNIRFLFPFFDTFPYYLYEKTK